MQRFLISAPTLTPVKRKAVLERFRAVAKPTYFLPNCLFLFLSFFEWHIVLDEESCSSIFRVACSVHRTFLEDGGVTALALTPRAGGPVGGH